MSELAIIDFYKKQGVNLVPIPKGSGKALDIPGGWKRYQYEMYTGELPHDQDFAVILGKISKNLIVLDFDQCDDIEEINNFMKDILNKTLVVRTGDGYHVYYTINQLPPQANTFLKKGKYKMEVKGEGAYVIGASCKHYDKDESGKYVATGKTYTVISNTLTVGHLNTTGEKMIEALKQLGWESQNAVTGNGHHIIIPTSELEKGKWCAGERYNNGFKLALRRFHMGLEYDNILNEAFKINLTCNPPHNETEVERWVNDAHTQYQKNLNDPANTYFKPFDDTQKKSRREEKQDLIDVTAEQIQSKFRFKAMRDNEEIVIYDGKVYRPVTGKSFIKEECEKVIPNCDTGVVNQVVDKIIRQNFVDRDEFDSNPNLLTLENCVLDIATLETFEHSPSNLTCIKLPVEYEKTDFHTDGEIAIKDIESAIGETMFYNYLKSCFTFNGRFDFEQFYTVLESCACCLLKTSKFEKAFMFIGTGGNGKSVLIDFLLSILGDDNVSNIPIQEIAHERFKKAELYGKMANLYADIESDELQQTGTLKALISGDRIIAERKHQHPFSFKNYAKMLFSANRFPQVSDQTDAMFRRFVIVEWQRQFLKSEKDIHLKEKLCKNQQEKNKIFNFLVIVAQKLDKRGYFRYEKRIDQLRADWNKHSDPVALFIEELVTDKEGALETKPECYRKYREFCINKDIQPLSISKFGRVFGEYYETVQHKSSDGINRKVWQDILVKEPQKQGKLEEYD